MKMFDSLKTRWRRRRRSRHAGYGRQAPGHRSLGKIVMDIVVFPIRVLFLPFKALGVFHNTGIEVDQYEKKISVKKRLGRIGKAIVLVPLRILQAPFKLFTSLRKARRKDMLFALPSLIVIGFLTFVFVQVFARGNVIENRYRNGARVALNNGDLELAKTYYQRIIASEKLTPPQQYQWAMILAETGEEKRAEQLVLELAPDTEIGYGPAHFLRAISIAQRLGKTSDPEVLRKLRWHLQNSRELSPESQQKIQTAWASYYLATEQVEEAIKALDQAAVANPFYYLMISSICKDNDRESDSRIALDKAEKAFRKLIEKDELNIKVRISLANVLARQEKYGEAEAILKQGFRIQPDADMRQSMSDFYVMRHDLVRAEGADIATQIQFLLQAIDFDPNYAPVYDRMMRVFSDASQSPESAAKVKKAFLDIITSDNPTPMAHFALSTILSQEGERDKAQFHLEQAYELNNNMVVVLNNLAWVLAESEPPDLDRALELSRTAVERVPNNGPFRDTYGTVLMKLGSYKEAVSEFQLALPGVNDKYAVHEKLATCYKALGMDELAKSHAEKSRKKQSKSGEQ